MFLILHSVLNRCIFCSVYNVSPMTPSNQESDIKIMIVSNIQLTDHELPVFLSNITPRKKLKDHIICCKFYVLVGSTDGPVSLGLSHSVFSQNLVSIGFPSSLSTLHVPQQVPYTLPAKMSLMLFPFNIFLLGQPFQLIISTPSRYDWTSLVAQIVQNQPAMRETQVQSLGREDPMKKGMATHSSILALSIPWTEEPGGLQFMGSQSQDTTE